MVGGIRDHESERRSGELTVEDLFALSRVSFADRAENFDVDFAAKDRLIRGEGVSSIVAEGDERAEASHGRGRAEFSLAPRGRREQR